MEPSEQLPSDGPIVEEFVARAQHTEVKQCQHIKFQRILDKNAKNKDIMGSEDSNLASEIMSRWVKNCSDHLLSDPELSVLMKGLNFAVTPRKVPVVEIVTATK